MKEINSHIDQIKMLCHLYKVKSLFAFGSVTRDDFKKSSDVDLIVEIEDHDPLSYSDNYFNLKFQLENILHRHIDLLEQKTLKNPYLKAEIDSTKVLVYGS